ncbi:TspO/MBR family protein [Desulfuribacillus alkaliarsenatis]|uniref:TspO protein n=1 Tax=Desulfuribacillus alkaliarsenatis TaxID=766136 RepID=A0A1E5G397_9FIRM|nr:TspO/MBR family protein [Desulfuribacillus alkaliarsenatis]OEF97511.1 hypothetical protein BHF68_04710 [Desulfuribacillus alkaliarsenatis]
MLRKSSVFLAIATFLLFNIGSIIPADKTWYNKLEKPAWSPKDKTFGLVWTILFALISFAVVIMIQKGATKKNKKFMVTLGTNYVANQIFPLLQFRYKNMMASTADAIIVAFTALLMAITARKESKLASALLAPYVLWSTFASALSTAIYIKNKPDRVHE